LRKIFSDAVYVNRSASRACLIATTCAFIGLVNPYINEARAQNIELTTSDVSAAALEQVITSSVNVFLEGIKSLPPSLTTTKVQNLIVQNFDEIKQSVTRQVIKEASQSRTALTANIISSIIVNEYVDYATSKIVGKIGVSSTPQQWASGFVAGTNEEIVRLGANIVMSRGDPRQIAVAQSIRVAEIYLVDLPAATSEAVESAFNADVSELNLLYTEARGKAVTRIMNGDNLSQVLQDYDAEISELEDFSQRKLTTFLTLFLPTFTPFGVNSGRRATGAFNNYKSDMYDAHSTDIRSGLISLYEANVSPVRSEIEKNVQKYVDSQRRANPLAPYAPIQFDFRSILAEPVVGPVAQVGSVNEFIALSGNDLQTAQTVLVAEFASPDYDTGTPGVDGGGDEGGGGEDGGQDGDRDDPISSTSTIRSFIAAVSLDTEGSETGWQFVALEDVSEGTGELTSVDISVPAGQISVTTTGSPRGSQYLHLQFGVSTDTTTFVRNGQTFEASNTHWLYGNFTSPSNLALRTGTASYAGVLFGHAYDVEGPDLRAAFNSVTGDFTLSVDFSTNRASLEGNVVGLGSEPLSFSGGLNRDFYDLNEGERPSVVVSDVTDVGLIGISTQANLAFPIELDVPGRTSSSGQDDGYLYGSFFGDNASEFGGTFAFALDDTLATGVAVASRTDTLGTGFAIFETADNTVARRGGITVTELNNSTLSAETTGSSLYELESVTVNTADLDNGSFSYVSWGSWNDSGSYLGQDVSSGTIAFGQITPEENMPSSGTRNFGTANANSQVAGLGADGSTIDGSVQLTAEFGASRGGMNGVEVNGSFDFDRNGNDWATGTFSTETDVLRTNGFSADMTVDQGGDGRMFGSFAGPNAEEVFGNWQLNGVNDADLGSAQGIFRAN